MFDKLRLPQLSINDLPLVDYHFQVSFFALGILPNPLDIRFAKVNGMSFSVGTSPVPSGGENVFVQQLPDGLSYDNLVMERGLVTGSPLNVEIGLLLSQFKFLPSNVLVAALDKDSKPLASWLFLAAFPVRWSIGGLDASSENIIIETLELTYRRFQRMEV